jgi:hypothetical protein
MKIETPNFTVICPLIQRFKKSTQKILATDKLDEFYPL